MPQEFHVIRCYSCETFQVHIVKKSNKWDCIMCGEKQSVKKVYFQGSGKDCRINVQKLNEKRVLNELEADIPENEAEDFENENVVQTVNESSKWEQFLPKDQESSEDEVEHTNYTFNRPNKRKSFSKKTINKNKKIKLQSDELPDEDQNETTTTSTSKWKTFISNIENKSQNVLTPKNKPSDPLLTDKNNKSKWDSYVEQESEDDNEIPNQAEKNASLTIDNKQSSKIFSSDDNNLELDDILDL